MNNKDNDISYLSSLNEQSKGSKRKNMDYANESDVHKRLHMDSNLTKGEY